MSTYLVVGIDVGMKNLGNSCASISADELDIISYLECWRVNLMDITYLYHRKIDKINNKIDKINNKNIGALDTNKVIDNRDTDEENKIDGELSDIPSNGDEPSDILNDGEPSDIPSNGDEPSDIPNNDDEPSDIPNSDDEPSDIPNNAHKNTCEDIDEKNDKDDYEEEIKVDTKNEYKCIEIKIVCKLYHTRALSDRLDHFFAYYGYMLDIAWKIFIEQQPPGGLTDVEQLIFKKYRDKSILVNPNSMHKYFNMGSKLKKDGKDSNISDYEARKIKSIEIAQTFRMSEKCKENLIDY